MDPITFDPNRMCKNDSMCPSIRVTLHLIAFLFVIVSTSELLGKDPPPNYPHSHPLKTIQKDGSVLKIRTLKQWKLKREAILKGFQAAAGALPSRKNLGPLQPKLSLKKDYNSFSRWHLWLNSGDGDRISAHFYLPKNIAETDKRPGIIALHPTSPLGKRIVAGEGPLPNRNYATELAERGYVVIAPDYPSFGDLKKFDFKKIPYVSGTMKGIFNHMRCVDYLQARPEVDPNRIGAIGHSLGGHNAIFLSAFDQRIQVMVTSCGWTPFHDYYDGKIKGWTSDRYMPLLNTKYQLDPDKVPFDFYGLISTIAPRAFLTSSPTGDSNFEVKGVRRAMPRIEEVWKLYKVKDQVKAIYPEAKHDFPPRARKASYQFLDRALKFKPTKIKVDLIEENL